MVVGFSGSSALENMEIFSIVDATADAWVQIYQAIYHEKDEERKVGITKSVCSQAMLMIPYVFTVSARETTARRLPAQPHC